MQSQPIRYLLCCLVLFGCGKSMEKNLLDQALASSHENIRRVMDSVADYEVQIRYTQIHRQHDSVAFTTYDFQVNDNTYFYPASTVKFPAAVAALEKLNEVDSLTIHTEFFIAGDSVKTSFGRAIQEIFAVSDNAANNRLVEFLGQDDLNRRMKNRMVAPIRVSHRLSTDNADNPTTKPLVIYVNDSTTTTSKAIINQETTPLSLQKVRKGIGFYAGDSLYKEPFDFSLKNYFPISAQHELLKRVIFPGKFPEREQFNLSEHQKDFLLDAMHTLPRNTGYDGQEYYDGYGKFFMYGDTKNNIPEHIKIYNKVGYAYGTLTDCAYIKDEKYGVEFMLTATILVNKDGVFNDDKYEYDDIGIPFLAQLGRELYQLELGRK